MLLKGTRIAILSLVGLLSSTLTLGAPLPQAHGHGLAKRTLEPVLGIRQDPVPEALAELGENAVLSFSGAVKVAGPVTDGQLIGLTRKAAEEMHALYQASSQAAGEPGVMVGMADESGLILFASSVTTRGGGIWEKYLTHDRGVKDSVGKCMRKMMHEQGTSHSHRGLCGEINVLRLHAEIQGANRDQAWVPPAGARVVAWYRSQAMAIPMCKGNAFTYGCQFLGANYGLTEVTGNQAPIAGLGVQIHSYTRRQPMYEYFEGSSDEELTQGMIAAVDECDSQASQAGSLASRAAPAKAGDPKAKPAQGKPAQGGNPKACRPKNPAPSANGGAKPPPPAGKDPKVPVGGKDGKNPTPAAGQGNGGNAPKPAAKPDNKTPPAPAAKPAQAPAPAPNTGANKNSAAGDAKKGDAKKVDAKKGGAGTGGKRP